MREKEDVDKRVEKDVDEGVRASGLMEESEKKKKRKKLKNNELQAAKQTIAEDELSADLQSLSLLSSLPSSTSSSFSPPSSSSSSSSSRPSTINQKGKFAVDNDLGEVSRDSLSSPLHQK